MGLGFQITNYMAFQISYIFLVKTLSVVCFLFVFFEAFIFSPILLIRQIQNLCYFPRILDCFRQGKSFNFCQVLRHAVIIKRSVTPLPPSQEELKHIFLSTSLHLLLQHGITEYIKWIYGFLTVKGQILP